MRTLKRTEKSRFPPLLQLSYILQQLSDDILLKATGVGLSQVRIMSVLNGAAVLSQNRIAWQLGQTEANVSRQLRTMKRRGLVRITKNKNDARSRDVKLTAKGARICQKAEKILASHHQELLKLLDKRQVQTFNHTVQHLLKAL